MQASQQEATKAAIAEERDARIESVETITSRCSKIEASVRAAEESATSVIKDHVSNIGTDVKKIYERLELDAQSYTEHRTQQTVLNESFVQTASDQNKRIEETAQLIEQIQQRSKKFRTRIEGNFEDSKKQSADMMERISKLDNAFESANLSIQNLNEAFETISVRHD